MIKEYSFKGEEDEPDSKKRQEYNKEQKKKIDEKISLFVKPGNPGVKFKKNFDKMIGKLELPKNIKEQLDENEEEKKNEDKKIDEINEDEENNDKYKGI